MPILTTCIIIASVATPLLGVTLVLTEKYLRHDENEGEYVELLNNNYKSNQYTHTPMNMSFLNATFLEAAACNCPLLCSLLIEKGANEGNAALAIAIENGYLDTCKAIISSCPCDLNKALSTAQDLKKDKIANYIQGIQENAS
jgi:putative exporter of polyketide antibiotics